jgi:hypothetical protein
MNSIFLRKYLMSRDKWGLFAFGLAFLGFIVYVKTGSFLLFAVGIVCAALINFSKSKSIK